MARFRGETVISTTNKVLVGVLAAAGVANTGAAAVKASQGDTKGALGNGTAVFGAGLAAAGVLTPGLRGTGLAAAGLTAAWFGPSLVD
jgi:hypothetical protein